MAVLVTITNRGGSLAMYDEIAPRLVPVLKTQPGFHLQGITSYDQDGGGFIVHEVWDSREQHKAWFEGYVRPNIPPDAHPQVEYAELERSLVTA